MEQERVTKDKVQNLGPPDPERLKAKLDAAKLNARKTKSESGSEVGNARIIRRDLREMGMG